MSSANGAVRFNDGLVLYCYYHGTADVMVSNLNDSLAEVWAKWKKTPGLHCDCGKDEPVVLATDYGRGFSWDGRACRHCRSITAGHDPYADDLTKTRRLPEWWPLNDEEHRRG